MIVDASSWQLEPIPWSDQAACRGVPDPDLFFPAKGESTAEAKAVCAGCPVRAECLDYALRWRIDHGIWGGLSTRERQRIERGRPGPKPLPAPHGTTTRYARGCRCEVCREASWAYSLWHDSRAQ